MQVELGNESSGVIKRGFQSHEKPYLSKSQATHRRVAVIQKVNQAGHLNCHMHPCEGKQENQKDQKIERTGIVSTQNFVSDVISDKKRCDEIPMHKEKTDLSKNEEMHSDMASIETLSEQTSKYLAIHPCYKCGLFLSSSCECGRFLFCSKLCQVDIFRTQTHRNV